MKRSFITVFAWATLGVSNFGQSSLVPKFSAFPTIVETTKAKSIDFKKNPDARTFRTRLTEGLRGGVNFAGHFVVVGWGCGTGCISGAIVDARTGNVFWPEQFNALGVWYDG